MPTSRDMLEGITLTDGWTVSKKVEKRQSDTGSNFSAGYLVLSPNGVPHFLKAIDFDSALRSPDPARALASLTEAFNLERDLLSISKRFSCVVTAVGDGRVVVPQTNSVVQYLLFELAETTLRQLATSQTTLPFSVALHALHRAALGLRQLHREGVAHQDIKPSNVLGFGATNFKISDLGRASLKGRSAPHDMLLCAGDRGYSPIELLYGYNDPDFSVRRLACDAYMLGGLAVFLFCRVSITALIVCELADSSRPNAWGGTYSEILPQVQHGYSNALSVISREIPDDCGFKNELLRCIRELCDPDPSRRGHPNTRAENSHGGNVYDLDRYVSIFNRLSSRAAVDERRPAKQ